MKQKIIHFASFVLSIAAIIAVGIIFKSSWIVIVNSLLGVLTIFLLSQGSVIGNVVGISQLAFYLVLAIQNKFYGEIVSVGVLTLPTYIFSIYTWLKHRYSNQLEVRNNISWKEWLVLISISLAGSTIMFFVFDLFNTQNLIFSVLIFGFDCINCYLKIKRVKFNFVFQMICYLITLGLWGVLVIKGDLSYLPTSLNYVIYLIFCVLGLIKWSELSKRTQNNQNNQENEQKS